MFELTQYETDEYDASTLTIVFKQAVVKTRLPSTLD
jgi:hypothetical protein